MHTRMYMFVCMHVHTIPNVHFELQQRIPQRRRQGVVPRGHVFKAQVLPLYLDLPSVCVAYVYVCVLHGQRVRTLLIRSSPGRRVDKFPESAWHVRMPWAGASCYLLFLRAPSIG